MDIGVDEAGKGPVLGSMFTAVVAVSTPLALPEDIADSKSVSDTTRSALVKELENTPEVLIRVYETTVSEIDAPPTDMNTLTVQSHQRAVQLLVEDLPDAENYHVVLDGADADADRFQQRVVRDIPDQFTVRAEHQADETDPVVSAASLVAKEAREQHIEDIAEEHTTDIGSGYPSDSTTIEFLEKTVRDTGTLPPCARTTWTTSQDVIERVEQRNLEEFF